MIRRTPFLLIALFAAVGAYAQAPLCGTSPELDARLLAMRKRAPQRVGVHASPPGTTVALHDGTFVLPNDPSITPGHHPFDLHARSLVLRPASGAFDVTRVPLAYVEPVSPAVVDFEQSQSHFIRRELGFTFPIFGRSVTQIYVSAFNGITFEEPARETALQFDRTEAAVHRSAILSPLLLTTHKPSFLKKPRVFVEMHDTSVIVTWRSIGDPFAYDVQAVLTAEGVITFSYRTVAMAWGTPIVSPGFDPKSATRTVSYTKSDTQGVTTEVPEAIRPMVDIRKLEIVTFDDTELFAVRLTLDGAIDASRLEDDRKIGFLFAVQNSIAVDDMVAAVEFTRTEVRIQPFNAIGYELSSAGAFIDGNVIEVYGRRKLGSPTTAMLRVAAATYSTPYVFYVDQVGDYGRIPFATRSGTTDFSALPDGGARVIGAVHEAFVLGRFDPYEVWSRLEDEYGLAADEFDGIAMYQNFHTDLIFYASAYATGGNPKVDGITHEDVPGIGRVIPLSPTLMHMNHLAYDRSAEEKTASQLLLHEFGHRWMDYFAIELPPEDPRVLNPVSAHPAAYVHTPAAFSMHGRDEASVMGGAFFTPMGGDSFRASATNWGYSWQDLYAMGLADDSEVPAWFFVKGTDLPLQYFPPDGAVVKGTRRNVSIENVQREIGYREPSVVYAERTFRVLFVLVTDGASASEAELQTMKRWRALLERDFRKATGNRGSVSTSFAVPVKRRAASVK